MIEELMRALGIRIRALLGFLERLLLLGPSDWWALATEAEAEAMAFQPAPQPSVTAARCRVRSRQRRHRRALSGSRSPPPG